MKEIRVNTPYEYFYAIYTRRNKGHNLKIFDDGKARTVGFIDKSKNERVYILISDIQQWSGKYSWENIELTDRRARAIIEKNDSRKAYIEGER